jgi:hypothetical protein
MVLLTLFSVAVFAVLSQGESASADNRARVVASGLADRELKLAGEAVIAAGALAGPLAGLEDEVNPNVPADMDSGDARYAFGVEGEKFMVERHVELRAVGSGSACNTVEGGSLSQSALLVTVTVSWKGMGAATRPHTAAKLFPPSRDATLGLGSGEAALGVKVSGTLDPGGGGVAGPRPNVRVQVTGAGTSATAVTDSAGCAIFLVKPLGGESNYEVTVLGYTGAGVFVTPSQEVHPTRTEPLVSAGESRTVNFDDYERAASFTALVTGGVADSVSLAPASGIVAPVVAGVVGGEAVFDVVWPGIYSVEINGVPVVTVTLLPGDQAEKSVQVP